MKYSYPLIALAGLLALSACNNNKSAATAKDDAVVATVNGKNITTTEFNTFLSLAAGGDASKIADAQKQQALDRLIGMHLAADAAEKAKLADQPDTANTLSLLRTNVLSEAQVKKYMADNPITDEEIKTEYDAQVAGLPRQYHARHILVDKKETADAIIRDLKGGADFAKLAKDKSKDPGSAKNGGDLDWFTLDSMVKPFSDAVAKLQDGQITEEPVQSQFGWHVIKLEGSRGQSVPPLEEVKAQVKNLVQNKRVENYLADLRKAAKVEIKELPGSKAADAPAPTASASTATSDTAPAPAADQQSETK